MRSGWNIVSVLALGLLCDQSLGFWPFNVVAEPSSQEVLGPGYPNASAKRVAIIGAGAAGSSAAWNLHKLAERSEIPINITVFEKSSYVGGRSTTVNAYDDPQFPLELGASIFVEVNEILKNSSELFDLKLRASDTDDAEFLGIWNGEKFVYTQKSNEWRWYSIGKLIWKYGLAPIRTQRLMKSTVGKFRQLYNYPFFPFRSLSDAASDLGLLPVTSSTGEQLLAANNIGPPFTTDIIQASTRVNYGQNLGLIHGLETMVCMAIEGTMQIDGGNWRIFDSMLKASNSTVLLDTTVDRIGMNNGAYSLKTSTQDTSSGTKQTQEEPFDAVVLTAPLQFSGIEIEDGLLSHTPDKVPYVTLHVTLFASTRTLNPLFFNLPADAEAPSTVLTTLLSNEVPVNPEDGVGSAGFFSISTLRTVANPKTQQKEYLYKIFSPQKISSEFLSDILGSPVPTDLTTISIDNGDVISWYYPHVWHSYPYEYPRVTFEGPELAPGFYYTSGIESFISTMETSALMGMNVAQLIVDDHLGVSGDELHRLELPLQEALSKKRKAVAVQEL